MLLTSVVIKVMVILTMLSTVMGYGFLVPTLLGKILGLKNALLIAPKIAVSAFLFGQGSSILSGQSLGKMMQQRKKKPRANGRRKRPGMRTPKMNGAMMSHSYDSYGWNPSSPESSFMSIPMPMSMSQMEMPMNAMGMGMESTPMKPSMPKPSEKLAMIGKQLVQGLVGRVQKHIKAKITAAMPMASMMVTAMVIDPLEMMINETMALTMTETETTTAKVPPASSSLTTTSMKEPLPMTSTPPELPPDEYFPTPAHEWKSSGSPPPSTPENHYEYYNSYPETEYYTEKHQYEPSSSGYDYYRSSNNGHGPSQDDHEGPSGEPLEYQDFTKLMSWTQGQPLDFSPRSSKFNDTSKTGSSAFTVLTTTPPPTSPPLMTATAISMALSTSNSTRIIPITITRIKRQQQMDFTGPQTQRLPRRTKSATSSNAALNYYLAQDIENFFSIISSLDENDCMLKLVCQVHAKAAASDAAAVRNWKHGLSTYERQVVKAFRILDKLTTQLPGSNKSIIVQGKHTADYMRVARHGKRSRSVDLGCFYSKCKYNVPEIIQFSNAIKEG